MSKTKLAKRSVRLRRIVQVNTLKSVLFMAAGVLMASVGLKGFLLPNGFLDGGATGVALLLQLTTQIDVSVWIVVINLPFIVMAARQISRRFAVKSAIAILVLATLVHFLTFPTLTHDGLLIAVFGGIFLGAGIGLTMRGGAVIDGTEVLAISISRKSSLTVGDFIALFNVVLFSVAILFVSLETAMYSMLTYFAASKTVDFILNGIEEYIGVMIVSERSEEIRHKISYDLGRGITVFRSDKGFGKTGEAHPDRNILFCVITRLEVSKLLFEIDKIDAKAFVIQYPIRDTRGGMIKRRNIH